MWIKKAFAMLDKYFLSKEQYARKIGVKMGANCFIATRHWSSEPFLITIGNNVGITHNVYFHTHGGGRIIRKEYPDFDSFGKITVEDDVYIGTGAQICPGVIIGRGSLIAAGSIVTKSIPPKVVVGGNPAKFICSVDNYICKNIKYDLGCKKLSAKQKKEFLLNLSDEKFFKKDFIKIIK